MTDDDLIYGDLPEPEDEDFEDHRRETIAADPDDLEEMASMARETISADPLDLYEDRARETVVTDATMLEQEDHFRDDFDERLGRVRAKRARIFQQPLRPRRRRRLITPGCVALVMGISVIAFAFVVLAMFLPPFADANPIIKALEESGAGHVDLNSQDRSTQRDGLTIEVLPSDPGQNLRVAIQSVPAAQFLANDVPATLWNCQAADSLPRFGELKGSIYSLDFTGSLPKRLGVSLPLPQDANPDQVNLYGWYAEAGRWLFIPSQKSPNLDHLVTDLPAAPNCLAVLQVMPPIPVLTASIDLGQTLDAEIASQINRLYVTGMRPTVQGTLQGLLPGEIPENPEFSVLPLISNARGEGAVDVVTVQTILSNPESRIAHSANVAAFAETGSYAGVVIDYREVPPELRNQFSNFVQNLAHALHLQNRLLVVAVPPAELGDSGWSGGAYDWRTLGLFADELVIRAPLDPTAFAPDGKMENMLRWAVGEVDRYKLALGLSALSVEVAPDGIGHLVPSDAAWATVRGIRAESEEAQLRLVLDSPYEASLNMDIPSQTPHLRYSSSDAVLRRFWLTTANALNYRIQMAAAFNLSGFAVFDAQAEGASPGLPGLLRVYQDGGSLPGASLSVRWRVYDETGELISEELAPPNAEVVYPLNGPSANLRFEAAIIGDIERDLGDSVGAAAPAVAQSTPAPATEVAQAATPTPTLIPSATPSPEPTLPPEPTATPTIVPTINPPEVTGTLPADFEIGTHITGDYQDEKFNWMRVAGMSWVKIQLRYEPGMNADDYGWQIQLNHENGFKVLWGVVGDKNQVLTPGYFQEYADFVGRLAEIGANGIEVWNEMNLDREWPNGRIDPALYTQFLEVVYTEIKARNPDTLVISGALAPTGAEGAFGLDAVWNDDRYYQGLANAGAAQFMDCVGAHYNEGIVSPTQTSGDPRDPYPTRYLSLQTARAADPFGGQIPVCYTELGYLTPEGFGSSLPAGFEWAGSVTVAQQASWLGTAALLNAQSGKVRLMIIWNLDFTEFEVDPAGGYAIIRPDGACPACDTLGSLRPRTIIGGQ